MAQIKPLLLIICKKIFKHREIIKESLYIVAAIVSILGIGFIAFISPIINNSEPFRLNRYEKMVEKIKIGNGKDFVMSVMGVPNNEIQYTFTDTENNKHEIVRADYYNQDFLFTAFFTKGNTLFGYGLIARNKDFRPKLPYDNSPKLQQFSQEKYYTDHFMDQVFIKYYIGSRSDCSVFEMEFEHHHLATNNLIIGYGVSDIGFINNANSFNDYLRYLLEEDKNEVVPENSYKNSYDETIFHNLALNIRDNKMIKFRTTLKPNAVLVIDFNGLGGSSESGYEFICDELNGCFLYDWIGIRRIYGFENLNRNE